MRRMLSVAAVLAAGLVVPSTADAAIPQVFTKTASPVNCTVQASGQRFCGVAAPPRSPAGTGHRSTSTSRSRPRPPPAPTGRIPVLGLYHGWGGSKLSLAGADAQRALTRGYAVFTMTDRGWGESCGRRRSRTDPRLRRRATSASCTPPTRCATRSTCSASSPTTA